MERRRRRGYKGKKRGRIEETIDSPPPFISSLSRSLYLSLSLSLSIAA
jgi:hypothetical protein